MTVLSVQAAAKSYGGRDLFSDVSFDLAGGMRLAVVGPNGTGKSTLLSMVMGRLEPDAGRISLARSMRVGYAAQELGEAELARPLVSWVLEALPSWSELWAEWEDAAAAGDESRMKSLSARQAELEAAFGYSPEHRAKAILAGLGFEDKHLERPIASFSGGWRERAKLARALLVGEDLLILDEPTNHLDLEAVRWLEQHLLCRQGALLFVVHDRVFLDNVATHVLHLGGNKAVFRKGNFADFLAWHAESELTKERQAAKLNARIQRQLDYVRRFRAKARKASQAQAKLKQAQRMQDELDDITFEKRRRTLSFSLPPPARSDKVVVHAADLAYAFPDRPPLWPPLTFHLFRGQKVALAGPNGAGKSTLLKLVVGQLAPQAGSVVLGPMTSLGYFSQHRLESLQDKGTVLSELRRMSDPRTTEQELKDVLGLFLLGGEENFERPVARLSGGERSRLSLAALFLARANLLVLDEPTNHLDMESRQGLIDALSAYEGSVLMVAHDRQLLTEAADQVWAVGPGGMAVYEGGYAEYEAALLAQGSTADACLDALPLPKRRADKEERKRRADIRARISRELTPAREAYAAAETRLEGLLARQDELEALLADPATYQRTDEFVRLTSEYKLGKEQAEALFGQLSALEETIAALTRERDALLEQEDA